MNLLDRVKAELEPWFIEREELITLMCVALVAREHLVVLGEGGLGKSQLIRAFYKCFELRVYDRLCDPSLKMEDLFNSLILAMLEQGLRVRNIENSLAAADFAFLDEVFTLMGMTRLSLMAAMNERIFNNGGAQPIPIPLQSIFGGSNALPDPEEIKGDKTLAAYMDRWLLRYEVQDLSSSGFRRLLDLSKFAGPSQPLVAAHELAAHQSAVERCTLSDGDRDQITQLRDDLKAAGVDLSPRRWNAGIKLMKAHAVLRGATEVDLTEECWVLMHIWPLPEQAVKLAELVLKAFAVDMAEVKEQIKIVRSEAAKAMRTREVKDGLTAMEQIEEAQDKLKDIMDDTGKTDKVRDKARAAFNEAGELKDEVYQRCMKKEAA